MRARLLTAMAVCCVAMALPASLSAQTEVVEYYALDQLGSVRVVFDENGAVKSRRDYEPFGAPVTPITSDPKVWAGLFTDDESGLEYAQARMYQAKTGRFLSVDPVYAGLFNPQAWNRYAYARNSPLNFVDPDGRQFKAKPSVACEQFYCGPMTDLPDGGEFFIVDEESPTGTGRGGTQAPPPPPPPAIFRPDPPPTPPGPTSPGPDGDKDEDDSGPCSGLPVGPPSANLHANMQEAEMMRAVFPMEHPHGSSIR